jgi:hypothetical protein
MTLEFTTDPRFELMNDQKNEHNFHWSGNHKISLDMKKIKIYKLTVHYIHVDHIKQSVSGIYLCLCS